MISLATRKQLTLVMEVKLDVSHILVVEILDHIPVAQSHRAFFTRRLSQIDNGLKQPPGELTGKD
jgi:hypothetical protein